MKVLFLDIDGVLNSTRSVMAKIAVRTRTQMEAIKYLGDCGFFADYTISTIDPVAVQLLNRMFSKERIAIVLSSSHRTFFTDNLVQFGSDKHLGILQTYLEVLGLDPQNARLIDVTKQLHLRRGMEVHEWLGRHPNVTRHAALDDGNDFDPSDCTLIKTDAELGLTAKNYYDLTRALDVRESPIIY